MRLSDKLTGLIAAALGAIVIAVSRTFPAAPGQDIGPGLFPSLAGATLVVLGGLLVIGALRRDEPGWMAADDWIQRRATRRSLLAVLVLLVAWVVLVGPLGFIPTTILFLAVLMHVFGTRRALILPVAILVTGVTHYAFYTLLRVPLPWGVLQGVAW